MDVKKLELSRVYSFRTTEEGGRAWDEKIARSGFSKSEFFRKAVQENQTQVLSKPAPSADQKRAVFLLAKASNNLNQIAHGLNSERLSGKVTEQTYFLIQNQLLELSVMLIELGRDGSI